MATIRKQYRGFQIRLKVVREYPFIHYSYAVTGTNIKGQQDDIDGAFTCALEDIEAYIEASK